MKRIVAIASVLAAAVVAVVVAARIPGGRTADGAASEFTPAERELILQHAPLGDPPKDPTNAFFENPAAARLGQRLFFDPGFSKDGNVSCATCHVPDRSFADGLPLPDRFPVDRHVPTLWNVAYNRWFFWDGRADSLWSQALKPIENPKEHAFTRLQAVHRVVRTPALRSAYEGVFGPLPDLTDVRRFPPAGGPAVLPAGSPLHAAWTSMSDADRGVVDRVFANLGKAIAAYERNLVSRKSAFDRFAEGLRTGDAAAMSALSAEARKGLKLFVGKANCRLCHSGPNFTDGEFHNLGVRPTRGQPAAERFAALGEVQGDPFNTRGPFSDDRAAGAKKLDFVPKLQDTWGQIKTPTLRNAARTAPYMHQGQFKSLQDVVRFYSTLEGRIPPAHSEPFLLAPLLLSPAETAALVAFLESLTDDHLDPRFSKPLD